jgi:integrase/recombinase XerD
MEAEGVAGDFTACDTGVVNRVFRWYYEAHSQGGTNTKQRNLRHLFSWLATAYGHPHPYTEALVRYAPVASRPLTLAGEFIADMLEVTGGGRARDFRRARDHAIIRLFTEGVRRAELVQIRMADLPLDLIATPYVRVVPLKGARAEEEGRIVPLTPATAQAILVYLRARRGHAKAEASPALWLGTRGPLTGSGVYRMIKLRAEEAGYDPTAYPHMFRHTFAHDWQMSIVASGASFRIFRVHALPAAQRATCGCSQRDGARRTTPDLGCHQPVAVGLTMMQPVLLCLMTT